jgi:hypothetical protein
MSKNRQTVQIDAELLQEIRVIAVKNQMSYTELVEFMLRKAMKGRLNLGAYCAQR